VRRLNRCSFALFVIVALGVTLAPEASAQPRPRPVPATRADVDRLERKVDDQQKRIDKLIKLQLQYLQSLLAMSDGSPQAVTSDARSPEPRADGPVPPEPKPASVARPAVAAEPRPRPIVAVDNRPRKPRPEVKTEAVGNVVGKVTGAADAVVYVEDIVVGTRGSAAMNQQNKQFTPSVLVVQKGTTVQFPNQDAIFHNVFSVTPDNSFDLGSYRQGETKGVMMSKPGVVSVYCNMHPQMVGHILVVPNGNYVRAGKDGFFRLSNVPAGHHRIVAWAPDARPAVAEAEVSETEPVTVELELKKGRGGPHLKKDGLPYGSYEK
jgi:plastocyanin